MVHACVNHGGSGEKSSELELEIAVEKYAHALREHGARAESGKALVVDGHSFTADSHLQR